MATGARAGTHVLAVDHESTAFNTAESDFDSVKLRTPTWDVSTGMKRQAIENSAVRVDLGEHPPGLGLQYPESEVGFTTYLQGLGTAAGDGVTAARNAFSTLMASCLGGTPTLSTGSVATGTPTTLEVIEADLDAHADDEIAGFEVGGLVYARPIGTYDSGTGTCDLLMALPSAPVADDVVYGAVNIKSAETSLFRMQGQLAGKNTAQNYKFYGCVGNFSLPESTEAEAQSVNFTYQMGKFTRYDTLDSGVHVAPSVLRPLVNAGGEFLLAKFGQTATTSLSLLRIGVELARTYTADPDAGDDSGLCGWVLTDQQTRITLHVRDTATLPTGISASNYYSAFGSATLSENDFHLLLNFGKKTPGSICSFYFPRIHMVNDPEPVDIDGIAAQKLTFALTQGQYGDASQQDDTSGLAKIWFAQL